MRQITLLCIPFAGGSKFAFNDLKKQFPPHIAAEGLEYPGRGYRIREPLIKDFRLLRADLFKQIQPFLDKPFAFFGHSMGAGFAALLAHELKAQGLPTPLHIFASGRNGLAWEDPEPDNIHLLPRPEFIAKLRELGGSPDEVLNSPALMEMFEPILRADFSVLESYEHEFRPPLEIPFTVMTGTEEKDITAEGLAAWQSETSLPVRYLQFPGNHFFIFERWQEIAALMTETLA